MRPGEGGLAARRVNAHCWQSSCSCPDTSVVYRASGYLEPKQEAEQEEEGGEDNRNGAHPSPAGVAGESPRRKKRKRDKKRKGNNLSAQEGDDEVEKPGSKGDFDISDLDRVPGYEVWDFHRHWETRKLRQFDFCVSLVGISLRDDDVMSSRCGALCTVYGWCAYT